MIPKVKFTIAGINEIIDVLMEFLNMKEEGPNKEDIFNKYPLLKERLENSKEINQKEIVINFFAKFEDKNKKIFKTIKDDFQKEWDKINDPIMVALEKVNEIKWNSRQKEFIARVTSNPICPRYLSQNTFDIFFGIHNDLMKKIVLHELSHFIFFEKWKSIHKDYDDEEFETPHLLWKLSEMIPYIILKDKRIQEIYEHEPCVYDIWHKTKIKGKPILDLLQEIYDSRKDFEDFVNKSWELINANKECF